MTRRNLTGGGSAIVLALAFCFAGCSASFDDGYAPETRLPLRDDVLVVRPPSADPTGRPDAGKLDEFLRDLQGRPGAEVLDPAALSAEQRDELARTLEALFGTPASPKLADVDAAELVAGARLYKSRCTQCHGHAGDGRGPTGQMVFPPPRDFRTGQFKYTAAGGKPTRDDLAKAIRNGVAGNAMPGFPLLPADDIDRLAGHVVYLGVRGRVEFDAIRMLLSDDPEPPAAFAEKRLSQELAAWRSATATATDVPANLDAPERIRAGHALFVANCASCHADYGRSAAWKWDAFGVPLKPANLTLGQFHGGKEPRDLYDRVRHGQPAANMPALNVPESQCWDVVAFLLALPTPRLLPSELRANIYPEAK